MTSEADQTAKPTIYELSCNDCSFESTVEGTAFDALDVADAHQENQGNGPIEHFVNFQLVE